MMIDVVDNTGVSSMSAELSDRLASCSVARLATASLTRDGLRAIERAVTTKRKPPSIKLLVGLYNGHTESAALRKLLSLQKRMSCLEVKIAKNRRFHWKLFIFTAKGRTTAYVGSSNLTGDGLGTEGEFNLRLCSNSKDRAMRNISETFERAWRKDAEPLTERIADKFTPISDQSLRTAASIDPQIAKVLRPISRAPRFTRSTSNGIPCCFTFFEEFAEPATQKEVRHKTHWDSKGWGWIVFHSRADRDRLMSAGAFYLAELHPNGGKLSLNDVRDEDEFGTEDGRFFIAFQKRRGSIAKTLSPTTLRMLRREGVIRRKADLLRNRTLGSKPSSVLKKMLRVK